MVLKASTLSARLLNLIFGHNFLINGLWTSAARNFGSNMIRFNSFFGYTAIVVAAFLTGCAGKPVLEVAPEDWVYEDRAITIQVESPSDLNAISGRPHSLVIGLFQLSDPNTFDGLAATQQGAIDLLNKGKIDDTVSNFTRVIVQPGESKTTVYPRSQGAKFIGLVVGYYGLNPELDVKVIEIPEKPAKRGAVDLVLSNLGLVANEAKAVPDKLYVIISLGRDETKKIETVDPIAVRVI